MPIKRFKFEDKLNGWKLNEVSFSSFNLLVGMSGVGKTRILYAIGTLCEAAFRDVASANGCSWEIEFETNGTSYTWYAEVSLVTEASYTNTVLNDHKEEQRSITSHFVMEKIIKGKDIVLVDRNGEKFDFDGNKLPLLNDATSAISLLANSELISPVYSFLNGMLFNENSQKDFNQYFHFLSLNEQTLIKYYRIKFDTLERLGAAPIPLIVKAYMMNRDHAVDFQHIKDDYADIFPSVCDMKFGRSADFDPVLEGMHSDTLMTFAIKEHGIEKWIPIDRISSGMLRTLIHLFELALSPSGTVILIDELEDSLGVNCLAPLTRRMLERSRDLQFIVTSHHPYIIDHIPTRNWRIVTRHGSTVTVLNEDQVPALKTASVQNKFIQLINAIEYEEGIQ